jgi:hypothetical protein
LPARFFYVIENKNNLFNFSILNFQALFLFYSFNQNLLWDWVSKAIIDNIYIQKEKGKCISVFDSSDITYLNKSPDNIKHIIEILIDKYNSIRFSSVINSSARSDFNLNNIDLKRIRIKIKNSNFNKNWSVKHYNLNSLSSIFFLYKSLLNQGISPAITEINWNLHTEVFYRENGGFHPNSRYEDAKLFFKNSPKKIQKRKIKGGFNYENNYERKIL